MPRTKRTPAFFTARRAASTLFFGGYRKPQTAQRLVERLYDGGSVDEDAALLRDALLVLVVLKVLGAKPRPPIFDTEEDVPEEARPLVFALKRAVCTSPWPRETEAALNELARVIDSIPPEVIGRAFADCRTRKAAKRG